MPPRRELPAGMLELAKTSPAVLAAFLCRVGEISERRGYSLYQTTAILADTIQESNLSPRAVSPNKLWVSIFQQDASCPGRHNPNLAIAELFNRLYRHGGSPSLDI
jgi:hypothetical protein